MILFCDDVDGGLVYTLKLSKADLQRTVSRPAGTVPGEDTSSISECLHALAELAGDVEQAWAAP